MAATALPSLGDSNVDKSRSRTTGAGTKWLWDASELTLSDDKSGKQGITKTLPYFTKRPPIRVVHWRQRDASEHRWRRAEWPSISFPNYSLKESSKTQHHITENSRGTMLSNATMSSPPLGQAIRSSNGSPSNTTEGFEEILLQLPPGVKNAIAIHAVMGMGLLVLLLLCFFMCVIFLMRFYYKDRENELLLGTSMANDFPAIRIQKEKSPYVITPTQKITQRFLSGQKTPSMIECNFEDIAGILHFMASYIEIVDDVPFRPAHLKARLVPRARTKFDDSQAPPFEIEPSLQKMMFAQSPRFRGEAMKSELDRREQEVINKNPVLSGKPEEEAGNKEVANPRKGRKSQFEHNRQRRKHLRPSKKLNEGKGGRTRLKEKKKFSRKLPGHQGAENDTHRKSMNRVESKGAQRRCKK